MIPIPSIAKQLDGLIRKYCETGDTKILNQFREVLDECKIELSVEQYEYFDMWHEEQMNDLQAVKS